MSDFLVFQAFKLFDIDGDGVITIDELKSLVSKVGGDMSEAEAKALIDVADKDGNMGIDFSEFAKLWESLHGEGEASRDIFSCENSSIVAHVGPSVCLSVCPSVGQQRVSRSLRMFRVVH